MIEDKRYKYYIYLHINPLRNEIFYVGKGCGKRAFSKSGRSSFWKNIVKKYGYIVDIVEDNLTEDEAFKREVFYIKKIGRRDLGLGTLINMTDGGEIGNNRYRTLDHRTNLSKSLKGRVYTDDYKINMSKVQKDRLLNMTEEYKKNMTKHIDRNGVKHSDESKFKMSNTRKNFDNDKKNKIYNKFKKTYNDKYKLIYEDYKKLFIDNIDLYLGNIRLMCRELNIGRGKFYNLYRNDNEFKLMIDFAIKKYKTI